MFPFGKAPEVLALVPARGGSKAVPGKNLRSLGGHPLIAYSIAAALKAALVSRVIVTTDSPAIAEVAKRYGASVPFLRPAELSADHSPDIDYVRHALQWLDQNEGYTPDFVVQLRPTTPLRDPRVIDRAIVRMAEHAGATSLRSAHAAAESPFKWFLQGENGLYAPLLPTMTLDDANLPRQNFPKVFVPNGYVDIVCPSHLGQTGELYGPRMVSFETEIVTEVDTPEDFDRLEFEVTKRPPVVMQGDQPWS